MKAEKVVAVDWTGPQKCYRAGGYSIFHKDETALLNGPEEVLFFQPWGTPSSREWEPVHSGELGALRPPCPVLACGSSGSVDLDGLWFECLSCGKTFKDLNFRMMTAGTAAEGKAIQKRHQDVYEKERLERHLDELEIKIALKTHQKQKAEEKREAEAIAKKAAPPPPPPSRPRPPVYASILKFCEATKVKLQLDAEERNAAAYEAWLSEHPNEKSKAEQLQAESDLRAQAAYEEWLRRHSIVRPRFESWTPLCPGAVTPSVKLISDVEMVCSICGHAFWAVFHLGIVRPGAKCPCCTGKLVAPWRGTSV